MRAPATRASLTQGRLGDARRTYEEAFEPAWRAYEEAIEPARRTYDEAIAPAIWEAGQSHGWLTTARTNTEE